jgi:hypothetical protein
MKQIKNTQPEKLVDFDELRNRDWDLRWKEFTWQEKLFEAFVDLPHKMWLFVRRGVTEAVDFLRGRDSEDQKAAAYEDVLSKRVFLNRAMLESDLSYQLRHGIKQSFQEKAADIRRRAFAGCKDYGVLQQTGQLRCLNLGL